MFTLDTVTLLDSHNRWRKREGKKRREGERGKKKGGGEGREEGKQKQGRNHSVFMM